MSPTVAHISIEIRRPTQTVYDFAADPANLPKWAAGLSGAQIEKAGEDWFAESPMGRVKIKFCERNNFGVLDHDVTLPDGSVTQNPLRVVPRSGGSEVIFTIFIAKNMTQEAFEHDQKLIQKDLQTLKRILE